MADSKGVITLIGRKKLCMAHSGDAELPKIVKMAWGDGGVDESGEPKATTGNEVGLYNKLLEKEIEGHTYTNEEHLQIFRHIGGRGTDRKGNFRNGTFR